MKSISIEYRNNQFNYQKSSEILSRFLLIGVLFWLSILYIELCVDFVAAAKTIIADSCIFTLGEHLWTQIDDDFDIFFQVVEVSLMSEQHKITK